MKKPNNYINLTEREQQLVKIINAKSQQVNRRFRFWSALGASFGIVMVFYGFEKLIDGVPVLVENPWILLLAGIGLLMLTGSLYRKL